MARRPNRVAGLLALALSAAAWAEETGRPSVVHAFLPIGPESRLSYVARTTLDANAALHWEVTCLRSTPTETGGERVLLKLLARRWSNGKPLARQERYLREGRGIFTLRPAEPGAEEDYGPIPLLPSAEKLVQPDTVWGYSGHRPLPLAFHLLGILAFNDTPANTEAQYHVLNVQALETPAGRFPEAVQVTGVEKVRMLLQPTRPVDVLLRCRRWYVEGIGLVKEAVEFLDYPQLGRLTTELTGYSGLEPRTRATGVAVAGAAPAEDR